MAHQPTILILTAGYGEGHNQVAKSLEQQFRSRGVLRVEVMDLISHAYPLIHSITSKIYLKSPMAAQYGFDYYGWSYSATRDSGQDSVFKRYFDELGKKELIRTLRRIRPDVIINTFPFGAASAIGARLGIPVYTVITDYVVHSLWLHPDTTAYFAATEEVSNALIAQGVSRSRITVSGIPLRAEFEETRQTTDNPFRNRMQKGKELVLVCAGSYGVLNQVDRLVKGISDHLNYEVAVVCGRNARLEQKLKEQFSGRPNVHIFGFVDRMSDLMGIASCIVTKAGGITLSESVAKRLPLIIYRPLTGQESGNAHFFAGRGAAWIAHEPEELERKVLALMADRVQRQRMQAALAAIHFPQSGSVVAREVIRTNENTPLRKRSAAAEISDFSNPYSKPLHV